MSVKSSLGALVDQIGPAERARRGGPQRCGMKQRHCGARWAKEAIDHGSQGAPDDAAAHRQDMRQRPLRLGAQTQTKPNTGAKPAAADQKLCLTDMHPPTGQPRRGGPQHRRQRHRRQWLVDLLTGQGFDLGSHE